MTQQEALKQAHDDLVWAGGNKELQEKYSGELVLIHQREVIARGMDRRDLLEEAKRRGLSRDQVVIVTMLPTDFDLPPDLTL